MTEAAPDIRELDAPGIETHLDDLCEILAASVAGGGAIGFLHPVSAPQAAQFWRQVVLPEVSARHRFLFVAVDEGRVRGTVQLIVDLPPNQLHRAEVAKMMVHPATRRQGIGRALMLVALEAASEAGKTLLTLDTETDGAAEPLYRSVGFEVAGIIPGYALNPDGQGTHATTFMYRTL